MNEAMVTLAIVLSAMVLFAARWEAESRTGHHGARRNRRPPISCGQTRPDLDVLQLRSDSIHLTSELRRVPP